MLILIPPQPIRGRGSHGVAVVHNEEELRQHSAKLFKECPEILAEEFLTGEEITIAIMPPGKFDVSRATECAKLSKSMSPILIFEFRSGTRWNQRDPLDAAYRHSVSACQRHHALQRCSARCRELCSHHTGTIRKGQGRVLEG